MSTVKKQKLVTVEEAIDLVNKSWGRDSGMLKRQTLYNAVCEKKLERHGPKHCLLLDSEQVLLRYGKVS